MAIGGCTVEELKDRLTSNEWTSWKALKKIRPFGEEGADFRIGVATSALANLRLRRKSKPLDFMPVVGRIQEWKDHRDKAQKAKDDEAQNAQRLAGKIRALAGMFGGK